MCSLARFVVLLVLVTGSASAAERFEHPYFKGLSGEWVGTGSLTNAEGETTEIVEEWSASKTEDDTFTASGRRQWGEENQEFRWVFSYNVTTEAYECEYWHTGMEDPIRLEVSLSDNRAEMRTSGASGTELTVANTLVEGGIEGEVSVRGEGGREVLEGTVTHERRQQSTPE